MIKAFPLLFCALLIFSCGKKEESQKQERVVQVQEQQAQYVGASNCASCHEAEYKLWIGSDHQLAMQEAKPETVLGNFNDATFMYNGIQSTFFNKEGRYFVRTDGPDGKLQDYKVSYAFGVRPLQQYLIEFPKGRYQALSIVWDSRPKSEGGQKWFHLYPKEKIDYRDILHWTGIYQNWNHICAECHSTNLKKDYIATEDRFSTTWSEINVSCEQCHGPGSLHISWAKKKTKDEAKGLQLSLNKPRVDFAIDATTGNPARLTTPFTHNRQVEACAQCHSRRSTIREEYIHGRPLLDTHLPVLLEENLYYADGQIRDEVYEYDSFLQSKMFAQGVSCTNCHDAHSTKRTIADSRICAQCHSPEKYQAIEHHHHKPESAGSDCRSCHMPVRTYMVIDQRRDHSFRIPRPDLTLKLGTPNACNECHQKKDAKWAAQKFEQWYGKKESHFGETIVAARKQSGNLESELVKLIEDRSMPAIVRATALVELRHYLGPRSLNTLSKAVNDPDPIVRLASLQTLEAVESKLRLDLAFPLLKDPLRGIRIRAVGVITGVPRADLSAEQQKQLDDISKEYVAVQKINADRPEAQMNLGVLYANEGKYSDAESAYRKALQIRPSMIQAYVNLADLYRLEKSDEKGEPLLKQALQLEPQNPEAYNAMGLLLVRLQRPKEALPHFAAAAKNGSDPHYSYVYAVALNSAGKTPEAMSVLKSAAMKFPGNREILFGIIAFARDADDLETAKKYMDKLYALYPEERSATEK
jgi:Tfp pilus assembly protein PilF